MARNIDLDKLIKEGRAEIFHLDVDNKYVGPNFLLAGDPTLLEKVPFKEGDPLFDIIFEPQTYQELELKEDDIVTFGSNKQEWRLVETTGLAQGMSASFAKA